MDLPNGRIFLAENYEETDPDVPGFLSNDRLFNNADYAYPTVTQPLNPENPPQVILLPEDSHRFLLYFECYLGPGLISEDNSDTIYPLKKLITDEEAIQIVAWCIQNRKRVFDYEFSFFALAAGEYSETELEQN